MTTPQDSVQSTAPLLPEFGPFRPSTETLSISVTRLADDAYSFSRGLKRFSTGQ
jgi:hypothetical protein